MVLGESVVVKVMGKVGLEEEEKAMQSVVMQQSAKYM